MVTHVLNPSTHKAKAGGSLWVLNLSGLHRKIFAERERENAETDLLNHRWSGSTGLPIISVPWEAEEENSQI